MVELTARARMAHLLRRAGFGASAAELDEYLALGFEGAVERLLNPAATASPEFSSERAYRAKIKGPAEYVAGLLRTLGLTVPTSDTVQVARRMGQEILNPPNVGGWTSGLGWISPGSILERANYANKLAIARQSNANVLAFDPNTLLAGKSLATPESLVDHLVGLLLDGNATVEQRNALVATSR